MTQCGSRPHSELRTERNRFTVECFCTWQVLLWSLGANSAKRAQHQRLDRAIAVMAREI